jgi:hypothetical protein
MSSQLDAPADFHSRKDDHATQFVRGSRVGPKAGLDDVEKKKLLTLPGAELRKIGRPAHS